MSSLPVDSFASYGVPLWASATQPLATPSPLVVVDALPTPTHTLSLTAAPNGTATVTLANADGTNPLGLRLTQGATQPTNVVSVDLGTGNILAVTASGIVATQPLILDQPVNPDVFVINQTATTTVLEQVGGGSISLRTGSVVGIGTFVTVDSIGTIQTVDGVGEGAILSGVQKQLAFIGPPLPLSGSEVAVMGLSGTSAYLGTGGNTPTFQTPGVLVNEFNGSDLRFTSGSTDPIYSIKAIGADLVVTAEQFSPIPSIPAITISTTGQVSIPDLISTSSVPIGGIIMYSGSPMAIPANYHVCDGTGGTPDLRDRFIIGAGGGFIEGTSGGSDIIDVTQLPSHTHSVTDPTHTHLLLEANQPANANATSLSGPAATGQAYSNIFGAPAQEVLAAGTGITIDATPAAVAYYQPYYALTFIQRIA